MLVSYQISQANKQLFDWLILISNSAAKNSSASGQRITEKKGKRVRFHSWNFRWSSNLKKNFSTLFGSRRPLPHVLHMCLRLVTYTQTHTRTSSTLSGLGFGLSPYPWWSVLYSCTSHFLLVDDVHELNSVIAFHVNHRPL